jgi:PKD repeat protein
MHSTQVLLKSPRAHRALRVARLACLPLTVMTLAVAGCTHKADTPPGTGPSELALSLGMTASPDVLDLDGLSQSQVTITARGPDGAPMGNVNVNLDIKSGFDIVDIGRLSSKNVTTGSDGRAVVTYTAPLLPPQGNSDGVFVVTIGGTPVGNDFSNAIQRTVDIRLKPRGVILPQPYAPVPRFTFSPTSPGEDVDVRFDASASIAACIPDPTSPNDASKCSPTAGSIVSYLWEFGNGRTGSGVSSNTFYSSAGTFIVKLTVTNDRGLSNSTTQSISIAAVSGPTAAFTASPQTVGVFERVNVDASASKASGDRFIAEYNWTWGDSRTASGVLQSHTYSQAGTYTITLTVVDSSGKTGTATQTVTVGTGILPTANFSFSPTNPAPNTLITFDATLSTAPPGRTIKNYEWNFGDGPQVLSGPDESRPTHRYTTPGTYTVTLTVTDNTGAKSPGISKSVTVTTP